MTEARLVHIVDDVPELEQLEDGPVLLVSLQGFLDAGNASALAAAHLHEPDPGRVVASFEIDELYDYRARRPPMSFLQDHYADYEAPRLVVRLLRDAADTPYLVLSGPEPDIRWEAFVAAVRRVVDHFGVRLVVPIGSVPMAVPHTRPVQLTNHATAEHLRVQQNVWTGNLRVPASAQALLELRLGEWGHDVVGFVAHIPHYAAQLDYPTAAAALLTAVAGVTALRWDLEKLEEAGRTKVAEISEQVLESEEVRAVVEGLEQQYDAFHAEREPGRDNLLAPDEPLPSGEEIGAQFERFLAGLDGPEEE